MMQNIDWQDLASRTQSEEAVEYTAANIAAKAHAVNTRGKFIGKRVWDNTGRRELRARGTTDISPWDVIDGSAAVTPA